MTSQLSLFTTDPDLSHLSRRTDPGTSHAAAQAKVTSGGASSDREKILAVLKRGGEWTGGEIAEAINRDLRGDDKEWTNVRVIRRTGEMERSGLIARCAERACKAMGTNQGTYRAV